MVDMLLPERARLSLDQSVDLAVASWQTLVGDVLPTGILSGPGMTGYVRQFHPISRHQTFTLTRLTSKLANTFGISRLSTYFSPRQLGVGTPGGCEAAVHASKGSFNR